MLILGIKGLIKESMEVGINFNFNLMKNSYTCKVANNRNSLKTRKVSKENSPFPFSNACHAS